MKCEVCGKEHDGSYGSGRFCSKHCRAVYSRRKQLQENSKQNSEAWKLKNPINTYSFTCQKCGTIYTKRLKLREYNRYSHKKHFCSRTCANSRVLTTEYRQKISASIKSKNANKIKPPKIIKPKSSYCSLRKSVCLECGKEIYLHTTANTYCSECIKKYPHVQKYNIYDSNGNRVYGNSKIRTVKYNKTDPDLKHIIYKTTNDIDGKFYIGKHQTFNLNDQYLGSGVHLKRAIAKYGKQHFHREILFIFDTEEEMNNKEKELITEDLLRNPQCYNMTYGGEGGDTWSFTGRHHTEETKKKLREIALKHRKNVV